MEPRWQNRFTHLGVDSRFVNATKAWVRHTGDKKTISIQCNTLRLVQLHHLSWLVYGTFTISNFIPINMIHRHLSFFFLLLSSVVAFNVPGRQAEQAPSQTTTTTNRRSFVVGGMAALTSTFLMQTNPANAIPMITTDEFRIILRDSAQAIKVVEFSGPKSDVVTVKLVDGTSFGLSDVIESPVDPRSPLKIAAMCRENLVATKFSYLEAALSSAPKKKKIYSNERVQIAAEKEKARKERMEQDEADRLAKLYQYELEQAEASKASSAPQ